MYLLDTHVFYWYLSGEKLLNKEIMAVINSDEPVYVSICSFWEMAIKNSIGKFEFDGTINDLYKDALNAYIEILPVKIPHIQGISALPFIHRDPFDRMLISQAIYEGLTLVTADENILKYTGVKLIKA